MKIGLHDSDKTGFPNLALMKLSAHHKAKGDSVNMVYPLLVKYDIIYSSKVFTFTKQDPYIPNMDCEVYEGGTGYHQNNPHNHQAVLPDHTEHIRPDYSLYNIDYAMGFTTRGCIRNCDGCFVPTKEGAIREHADLEEFTDRDIHDKVVLMDNNILAHRHGIKQLEKTIELGIKVDVNQGMDARLIDDGIARLLSKVKWDPVIRLACDSPEMIDPVFEAVKKLRWHNAVPRRYSCYTLIRDVDEAVERIKFLKGIHLDPFAQVYRDKEGTPPTVMQKELERWVNHKAEFKSQTWEEYRERVLGIPIGS